MISAQSLHVFDAYWAAFLGCTVEDLNGGRAVVVRHAAGLAGWRGILAFRRLRALVVSVPPLMTAALRPLAERHSPDEWFDRQFLLNALRHPVASVTGPTYHGACDATGFRSPAVGSAHEVRQLTPADRDALHALQAGCDPIEWQHGSLAVDAGTMFGAFDGGRLVAAASYTVRGDNVAFIGAVTHPEYRGRGHGMAAAGAATRHGLDQGMLVAWQTLRDNAASVALARALGFEDYASHYAVQLRDFSAKRM